MRKSKTNKSSKKTITRTSLARAQMMTKILEEELDTGLVHLDRVQKQKKMIASQVIDELEAQKKIREKIRRVKKEIKLLKISSQANEDILDSARRQRLDLDNQMQVIDKSLAEVKKHISPTIENDFSRLIDVVNLSGEKYKNQKSVVLTCAKNLIQTTTQNEFEDFIWRAKVASNKTRFGMRLRFEKLHLSKSDLSNIYQPTIKNIAEKFAAYNLDIQTKTRQENGIIVALDLKITIPLKSQRTDGFVEKRL